MSRTPFGRFCLWYLTRRLQGWRAVHDHSLRELRYFKERLEAAASAVAT